MPDLLHDAADLMNAAGIDPVIVRRVVAELRRRWGGDTPYIPQLDRQSRDAEIRAALDSGKPIDAAAKAARCSPATVRRKRSQWL